MAGFSLFAQTPMVIVTAWRDIIPLIVGGSVKPIVERVYPLCEAGEVLRHLVEDRSMDHPGPRVSSATGWDRKGADVLSILCRTDPDAPPERSISVILVERPASGLIFERAVEAVGHRAHLLPQFRWEVAWPSR
jgi:hypothetical protein